MFNCRQILRGGGAKIFKRDENHEIIYYSQPTAAGMSELP
jgi:hypothetical protein